jgi:acetyl-CoA carboxylase biotin carboxyl carrier protein
LLTFEQMKELIELVAGHRLGGVEVREADFHFRVHAQAEAASATQARPLAATGPAEAGTTPAPPQVSAAPAAPEAPPEAPGHLVTSPIVGTFYSAPSPDAEPYARVGDRVQKGQVICIIEAMKLMNEIESDVAGVVLEIYPENAQPVEFGEPLFRIKTD